jgi:hypothetical protein
MHLLDVGRHFLVVILLLFQSERVEEEKGENAGCVSDDGWSSFIDLNPRTWN